MPVRPLRLRARPALPTHLATVLVSPQAMFRVSSRATGEPHFGKSGAHRFDDPNPDRAARFGTCYFGDTFEVALAETLLRDRVAEHGYFFIERAVLLSRYHVDFQGADLLLADLTGASLKRMGGHAGLTGTAFYKTPQRWSAAIHAHPDQVDGFRYASRHLNTSLCYVVFDRAAFKIRMRKATPLSLHPDFGRAASSLFINSALARPARR